MKHSTPKYFIVVIYTVHIINIRLEIIHFCYKESEYNSRWILFLINDWWIYYDVFFRVCVCALICRVCVLAYRGVRLCSSRSWTPGRLKQEWRTWKWRSFVTDGCFINLNWRMLKVLKLSSNSRYWEEKRIPFPASSHYMHVVLPFY